MVDLGSYATEVLSAYGVTILLLAGVVWISVRRGVKIKARLRATEARRGRDV